MKTESRFQVCLKEMINDKPLEDINVISLCEALGSNRQTFYYHYRDISDVVESIFLKERVGFGKRMEDFETILKEMLSYVSNDFKFVHAIAKSYASDKLHSFLYSYFYTKSNLLIKSKNNGVAISKITRYISSLATNEIMFWISNRKKEKTQSLVKSLSTIWNYLIGDYKKELEKEGA